MSKRRACALRWKKITALRDPRPIEKNPRSESCEEYLDQWAEGTPLTELEKKLVKTNHLIFEQTIRLPNFGNIVCHNVRSYSVNLGALVELYTPAVTEEDKKDLIGHWKSQSLSFTSTVYNMDEMVHAQSLSTL